MSMGKIEINNTKGERRALEFDEILIDLRVLLVGASYNNLTRHVVLSLLV